MNPKLEDMQSRVLILGNGQVGSAIAARLHNHVGYKSVVLSRKDLDYTNHKLLAQAIFDLRPQHIINCVAYTDVNKAEKKENSQFCVELNTILPLRLATIVTENRLNLVHFSTDYVFDGKKTTPYTEQDKTNPINYYGNTKESADLFMSRKRVKVFRLQCVYSNHHSKFINSIENQIGDAHSINVVNDQITVPTHAEWIASVVVPLLSAMQSGLWNLCPDGQTSYADFAKKIVNGRCGISPIATTNNPFSVERPLYSVLDNSKIKRDFQLVFPTWEQVYDQYKI